LVPRKLRLHNFMAYRSMDAPIDFTGIHIACLTGPNGAGKSTLLDAMTWALWGQSRAKSDDDLVALGETDMEVELEFALGEELYRVLRKRTKPGVRRTGHSMLDLFIATGADGDAASFVPITGNTLRETERKILGLLRLDYDTFVNSALLLQGRADEFTTKRPDQRKQVLADVLGLSRYDRYAEAARDEARRREADNAAAVREIASLEREVALRPEFEAQLAGARLAKGAAEAVVAACSQAVEALREAQRLHQERAASLASVQERVRRAEHDLQELAAQEQRLTQRVAQAQALLARREGIELAVREYQEARAAEEVLAQAGQRAMALRTEQSRLETALERARGELVAQERLLARDVAQHTALMAERPALQQTVAQATDRLQALPAQEQELAGRRSAVAELVQRIGGLQQANLEVTRQGKDLRARFNQLKEAGAQGVCPLCGTDLQQHGFQRVVAEYETELARQLETHRANERILQQLEAQRTDGEQQVKATETVLAKERADAQTLLNAATLRLLQAEGAESAAAEAGAKLEAVRLQLAAGAFAPDLAEQLTAAQQRASAVAYDDAAHQALRQRVRALEAAAGEAPRLAEAERTLAEAGADLEQVRQSVQRRQAELAEGREQLAEVAAGLAAAPDVDARLTAAQTELAGAHERINDLTGSVARLEGEVERCVKLEGLLDDRRKLALVWLQEKALYDELTLAYGRRGIQALLIESALPELEDEANALLGRMTDNRLTVKLETQRLARTGNTIETLDIKIADELGTRPYELYSGGEAFRINFALRIALSKLLARRAGAPLPTLIIDEGFGTQDTAGREKLVDAVNTVAEEFQCVLVITHVEELKDVFPARIEVTKTLEGSQAVVVIA